MSGIHVVLLHNQVAPESMVKAAVESADFHSMLEDIPVVASTSNMPLANVASGSTSTTPRFTELEISNVPSNQEMGTGTLRSRLDALAKMGNGKVRRELLYR